MNAILYGFLVVGIIIGGTSLIYHYCCDNNLDYDEYEGDDDRYERIINYQIL